MVKIKVLVLVLCLGLLSIFLQGTVFRALIPSSWIAPNLVLLLVVFIAFNEVSVLGAVLAFCLGLILDLSSANLVGPWAGSCVVVYGVLTVLSSHLFIESSLAAVLVVFISSFAAEIVYAFLINEVKPWQASVLLDSFINSLILALLAPGIIKVLKKILVRKESSLGRA